MNFDLQNEKETLLLAEEKLTIGDFLKVAQSYNDRITDLEKLLNEIKSLKIELLKEKISEIKNNEEVDFKPFGYQFFNRSVRHLIK